MKSHLSSDMASLQGYGRPVASEAYTIPVGIH